MARSKDIQDPVLPQTVEIPRPRVDVLERGLENVFGLPSTEIKLKDPAMVTHWVNTGIGDGQYQKYKDAGYLPVRPEYLDDPERFHFTVTADGYVARGMRQEERLMYTLRDHYLKRQREKARINRERMNPHATKQELVQAAAQRFGDEAADFLHRRTRPVGEVSDSYEVIERRPEE